MLNSKSFKTLAGAGILASAALFSVQASAVVFDVSEAGGWTSTNHPEVTLVNAAPNVGEAVAPAGTYTTSEWFSYSNPTSQLILEFFNEDLTVGDYGGASGTALIGRVTHVNNVIFANPPTTSFPFTHTETFALNFVVAEDGNESNHLFVDNPNGFVTHTETLNTAPCAPFNGATGPAGTVCDDFFAFGLNVAPGAFWFDGALYTISFSLVSSALNANPLVFIDGLIYTPEQDLNILDIFVTITRIPEPGILALLGLGLLGFGLSKRRRA